jgi:hypothetical protein
MIAHPDPASIECTRSRFRWSDAFCVGKADAFDWFQPRERT